MTGLRPTRSDSRAAGRVAAAVHSATTTVTASSQLPRSSGSVSADRALEVRDRQHDQEGAAAEDEEARGDEEHEAPLGQDVGAPRLGGDRAPRAAASVLRAPAFLEPEEQRRASSAAR